MKLWTVSEVAREYGITSHRVRRMARARGLGHMLGPIWVFYASEVRHMGIRRPGRPARERPPAARHHEGRIDMHHAVLVAETSRGRAQCWKNPDGTLFLVEWQGPGGRVWVDEIGDIPDYMPVRYTNDDKEE